MRAAGPILPGLARRTAGLLPLAAALTAPLAAGAQVLDPYLPGNVPGFDTPYQAGLPQRPQPSYDQVPVRLGAFLLKPELDQTVGRDTNVTGQRTPQGSWFTGSEGSLAVNSDFGRDAVGAYASVLNQSYLDLPRQSQTDYRIALGGTYEIGRDKLTLAGLHLSLHEDQTAIDSAGLNRPLAFDVDDVRIRYRTEIGRWTLVPNAEYVRYRFDDVLAPGALLGQEVRNRDTAAAGLEVRYGEIPERNALVVVRALNTTFVSDYGGLPRPNSVAAEALAGVDYAFSGNLRLVALGGYELRRYFDPLYRNRSTPVVQGSVIWTPTGLTTLSATVSRTIEDAIGETQTGVTYTRARATVDHEYRRNWLLHGEFGAQEANYSGGSTEDFFTADAKVSYLVNRYVRVTGTYDFSARIGGQQSAEGSSFSFGATTAQNYTRHILALRLGFLL